MSTYLTNYRSTGSKYEQDTSIQPTKHKSKQYQENQVLKNHLKIVSHSSDKKLTEKLEPKTFSTASKTINQTPIKNMQNTSKKGLKIEIDNRLNKVYSHITKYRSISLRPSTQEQNVKEFKEQVMEQSVRDEVNKNKNKIEEEVPTINGELPYDLLRSYIQSIYEDYQIKDPFEGLDKEFQINFNSTLPSESNKKTERITVLSTPTKNYLTSSVASHEKDRLSTKKKILQLKRHFINELSMTEETTEKKQSSEKQDTSSHKAKMEKYFQNHVTFNLPLKEQRQIKEEQYVDNLNYKLSETKMTTVSHNNNYLRSYQSINLKSEVNENMMTNSRVEQYNLESTKQRYVEEKKISQTFRYCFVCEEAVLEKNIKFHERECIELKKILDDSNLTKEQLLTLIEKKVNKIQSELESSFKQIESQNLNHQLSEIKNYTQKFMENHNTQNSPSYQQNSEQKINNLIHNTNILQTLELINKLKWFVHMKNNFISITK